MFLKNYSFIKLYFASFWGKWKISTNCNRSICKRWIWDGSVLLLLIFPCFMYTCQLSWIRDNRSLFFCGVGGRQEGRGEGYFKILNTTETQHIFSRTFLLFRNCKLLRKWRQCVWPKSQKYKVFWLFLRKQLVVQTFPRLGMAV